MDQSAAANCEQVGTGGIYGRPTAPTNSAGVVGRPVQSVLCTFSKGIQEMSIYLAVAVLIGSVLFALRG